MQKPIGATRGPTKLLSLHSFVHFCHITLFKETHPWDLVWGMCTSRSEMNNIIKGCNSFTVGMPLAGPVEHAGPLVWIVWFYILNTISILREEVQYPLLLICCNLNLELVFERRMLHQLLNITVITIHLQFCIDRKRYRKPFIPASCCHYNDSPLCRDRGSLRQNCLSLYPKEKNCHWFITLFSLNYSI